MIEVGVMVFLRRFILSVLILAASLVFAGDKGGKAADKLEEWLPITQQDLQMKAVPGAPDASAVQLYYSYYKDEDSKFIFVYRRIKILRESGKKYADAEIEIDPSQNLKELQARTIHPDGSIVNFNEKVFDKVLYKRRGIKVVAKSFTLPEVTAGSIIEYRYTVLLPRFIVDLVSEWPIQGDLYTVKGRFRFRPVQGLVSVPTMWESSIMAHSQVAYTYLNQVDVTVPAKKSGNLMELEVENVPAFEAEEYMPPESDYKPIVLFYYGGREIATPDAFWKYVNKSLSEFSEKYIGNFKEVHDAAMQAIGSETGSEQKLRKLYARAQQIRNLSYERKRTEQEIKKEKIRSNKSAADVLRNDAGDSDDITLLFVAMARAAGFDAYSVLASDRRKMSFEKLLLSLSQINSGAALVKLDGKDVVLFPGVKSCPYGLIPWNHSSVTALKLSKSGGEFITTPGPANSEMRRTAKVALSPDGSLQGEMTVEFTGQEALSQRLEALKTDEKGRNDSLEEQVKGWMTKDAVVKLQSATGWDNPEAPMVARFTVEIPNFAAVTGKRMLASPFFFPTLQKEAFTHEARKYPIVFAYPFTENDEVTFKLPQGFALEQPPYRRKAGLSFAAYEISPIVENGQLVIKRSLRFDGLLFAAEDYVSLKGFFSVVQAGDGGQVVLQPQQSASAQP